MDAHAKGEDKEPSPVRDGMPEDGAPTDEDEGATPAPAPAHEATVSAESVLHIARR
jgi:hypothetical protein